MSYNGSGTFQINSSGQPVVTGTVISSTAFNALTADLATGLSTAITKDGQTTTTVRVPFAQGISSTLVTDATSATTGSIITAGGISTQKALWVGTTSTFAGTMTAAAANFSGTVAVTGGNLNVGNVSGSGVASFYKDSSPSYVAGVGTLVPGGSAASALIFSDYQGSWVERMRLDSSGNLGIGTASPSRNLEVYSATTNTAIMVKNTGSNFEIQSNNNDGYLNLTGTGNIIFRNGTSVTERARINSSGSLLVGTTSSWTGCAAEFRAAGNALSAYNTASSGTAFVSRVDNTGAKLATWNYNGSDVGTVTTNGTITVYGTTSDYRLKENVQPMTGGLATVAALKPVTYDWISNGSAGEGFIAHELQAIIPEAVHGEKDALDKDGKIDPQGVDFGKIVPHLVAAIQELTTRLAALEAK